MSQWVPFYKSRSTVCLGMRDRYFEKWLAGLADESMPCDELGLLTLSYLYRRHTVVYTASKLWSTIKSLGSLSLIEVLNECMVQLIYLRDLQFAAADPGFPQGGGGVSTPRGGGVPTYDFAKFSRKLHEIERIWAPRGGMHPLRPP